MNSVEIIGSVVNEQGNKFRKIKYPLPYYNEKEEDSQVIYARYFTTQEHNRLSMCKEGSLIGIRGHLDVDENFGTIIIVEQLIVLK